MRGQKVMGLRVYVLDSTTETSRAKSADTTFCNACVKSDFLF